MNIENSVYLDDGSQVTLQSLNKNGLVLYFYPKDMTSGCTKQAEDFRDRYAEFQAQGFEVVGVSRDSISRHQKFIAKHELPFRLIADEQSELCKAFDVLAMKSMYGRTYEGIVRSTFVIAPTGEISHEWRKVKVPGHVDEVLDAIKSS